MLVLHLRPFRSSRKPESVALVASGVDASVCCASILCAMLSHTAMDTGSVAKPVESEGDCPAKVTTRGRKRGAAEMLTSSSTYPTAESASKRSAAGQPDENDSSEAGVEEFLQRLRALDEYRYQPCKAIACLPL